MCPASSSQTLRGKLLFQHPPTLSALSYPPRPLSLTFSSQVELSKLAEDTLGGEVRVAGRQAGVVAQVRGAGPGNVQVSRGLGHEVTPVRRDEVGELVEEPAVGQAWDAGGLGIAQDAGLTGQLWVGPQHAAGVRRPCPETAPCSDLGLRGGLGGYATLFLPSGSAVLGKQPLRDF